MMGLVTLICQLCIYPSLSQHLGATIVYRIVMPCYVVIFFCYPLVSTYVASGCGGANDGYVWPALLAVMAGRTFLNVCAFTSIMIMVCESGEHTLTLGL